MKTFIFRDTTPCSLIRSTDFSQEYVTSTFTVEESVKVEAVLLSACLLLRSCLAYSATFKLEMTYSFGMSDSFQQTTWRYIREESYTESNLWEAVDKTN
jgi:hypothetical protein